ncbi:MAG: sigma-70 family RNA polymerase sigma factor [Candidatus Peregrinibacteria bacterium]
MEAAQKAQPESGKGKKLRYSDLEDPELVNLAKEKDRQAFDALVLKYWERIQNLVMGYTKDPDAAADIAQETFIKAYKALKSFRGESAFYTWLCSIGINTAKNYLTAKKRKPVDSDEDMPPLQDQETPESAALNEEILKILNATIENLPEEMRIVFTLFEFEDMSYEAIAKAMECPIGTVRSRIFRAREIIDMKLKPLLDSNYR